MNEKSPCHAIGLQGDETVRSCTDYNPGRTAVNDFWQDTINRPRITIVRFAGTLAESLSLGTERSRQSIEKMAPTKFGTFATIPLAGQINPVGALPWHT